MDDVLKKFVFDNPSSFVKKGSNNTESKKVKQIGALDYQKDTRNKKTGESCRYYPWHIFQICTKYN